MATTVKISELPGITTLNANTANTVILGLDIPTTTTGKITLTSLAQGLYSNNNLAVGNNYTILPNVVGQFTGNSNSYIQVNIQNLTPDGSGDYVVTADDGDDESFYIDMGINGSEFSNAAYTSMDAHDGYLFLEASGAGKGNLIIGTTNSDGEIRFIVGGVDSGDVVGTIDIDGLKFNNINAQITANAASANSVINTRVTANAASANSVINTRITANVNTLNASIAANTQSVFYKANAAFETANNALANTTGILDGSIEILGDLLVNGVSTIANTNYSADQGLLTITASETVATPSNDGYTLHVSGKEGISNRVVFDAYGTGSYPLLAGRAARGTSDSPSAVANGDVLMRIAGNGWGDTGFAQFGSSRIDIVATEDHTDSAKGTRIEFWNIPEGSTTYARSATFNGNEVTFTAHVEAEKGFVHTPRIIGTNQSTLSIDITEDSLVKAQTATGLVITPSNFKAGKVVEVWITNEAGSTQTITHGVAAKRSTINSTTFSMPATSSAHLKYYSLGTDLANTYVKVSQG